MNKEMQIKAVKHAAIHWIKKQMKELLGDGFMAKMIQPFADEIMCRYANSTAVDAVIGMFMDEAGNIDLDGLLDKYIDVFTAENGIQFMWADIAPFGAMLDKLNGGRINVITADDLRDLKHAVTHALKEEPAAK